MKRKTLTSVLMSTLILALLVAVVPLAQAQAPDPDLIASTFMGGSSSEGVKAIALGPNGNVYVTGGCGSGFPTTPGAYVTPVAIGGADFCVAVFDADLSNLIAAAYLGGDGHEGANDIAVDSSGNVYLAGSLANSSNYPTTPGRTIRLGVAVMKAL